MALDPTDENMGVTLSEDFLNEVAPKATPNDLQSKLEDSSNVITLHQPLKPAPCPFCGCDEWEFNGGDSDVVVQCCACLAEGPVATVGCRGEDELEGVDLESEATELWNKRPTQQLAELCGDASGSLLLDVQQDCIAANKRCADLESKLEALTNAAAGALGFLPRNDPGARMAADRIERVLGEIGVALPAPARPIVVGSKWRDSATESEFTVKRVARGKVTYLTPKDECWAFPEYTWAEAVFRNSFVWVSDPEPASEPRAVVVNSIWRGNAGRRCTVLKIYPGEDRCVSAAWEDDPIPMLLFSKHAFVEFFTWISDPPATSEGGEP